MKRTNCPFANPVPWRWDLDRPCLACHRPAEGQGTAYAHLRASVHIGACSAAVDSLERIYDRSPRGRWRPVREVVALANGSRCPECQEKLP